MLVDVLYLCKENELKWFMQILLGFKKKSKLQAGYTKKMIFFRSEAWLSFNTLFSFKPWATQAYAYVLTAWKHNCFLW